VFLHRFLFILLRLRISDKKCSRADSNCLLGRGGSVECTLSLRIATRRLILFLIAFMIRSCGSNCGVGWMNRDCGNNWRGLDEQESW